MAIARHKTRQRELREARALVRRVQRGDSRAFELLYATYEGRIYRFCHRLTGRAETAAALVELTFARALANLPEEGFGTLDVPAYLYATARTLAFERGGEPPGSRGAAEGEVSLANERLSPQERAVLALRDLEGRRDNEIAAALDVDEQAVPGLVGAARLHLLAELRPAGIASPCPGRLPDLSAHADGMLQAERQADLEAHVTTCADCRAGLFALREAALRYRSLPVPEPPGELGSRITRALGLVGLPARKAAIAEAVATGGRQTAVAVAMGALAILGVGVTIAASHEDRKNDKPAPGARPGSAAAAGPAQCAGIRLRAGVRRHHRGYDAAAPPATGAAPRPRRRPAHRAGGLSTAESRPRGPALRPESPPAAPPPPAAPSTPVTTPKPERQIPVQILPPVAPRRRRRAADQSSPPPAPPPAPEPPPPPQTTTA